MHRGVALLAALMLLAPTFVVSSMGATPAQAASTTGPAAPTGLTATSANGSATLAWTANTEAGLAGYDLYRSTSSPVDTSGSPLNGAALLQVTTFTDTGLTNGTTYYYALVALDGSNNRSPASETSATPAQAASTTGPAALAFNGTSQYVTFGPASGLNAAAFTLEAWVNWTGGGVGTSTGYGGVANAIPIVTKGRAQTDTPANTNMDYFLGIDASSGRLVGDFEDTVDGGNHPIAGTKVLTTNAWHHVAATYDGTTWRLYLDGILDKALVVGAFTPESTSIQHAGLATAMDTNGVAAGFFAGTIDEARIWNVARTGAQIRSTRDSELTSGSGLIGRWGLNDGSGTLAANSVAGSPNGTLVGAPAWVTGYGFPADTIAPAAPTGLTATAANGSATLTWTANTEADLAGYNLYRSLSSPVDTTGSPLNGVDLLQVTTFTDTGLTNGTTYHYALVALDGANNRSTASETSATPAVNGVPTVILNGPGDATTGVSTSPTLSVTPTDPEGSPMSVTFYGRTAASGVYVLVGTNIGVASGTTTSIAWPGRNDGQRYQWYVDASDGISITSSAVWTFNTTPGADPVLVGAGDIAGCANGVNTGSATAAVLDGIAGTVFTAGDNAYPDGTLDQFTTCYDPSWGGLNDRIKARTRPAAGNHDWNTAALGGYFGYFGHTAAGATSYYSYDLGTAWHVVVLDSECDQVAGGCTSTSPQVTWLQQDLSSPANLAKHVIAIWHEPRFSSGDPTLVSVDVQPFWDVLYQYHAAIVVNGHEHLYERMAPMNALGQADPVSGTREFTVGTGGDALMVFGTIYPTSQVRNADTHGVLKLTLHATSYDWQFIPVDGKTFTDSGTATVNAAPTAPTITSANNATFTVGSAGTFTVMTTGSPTPAISETGALPS
ncbi:MAG TPA: LamG-like jellyroll fold domain-containing protein, partial [Cellulomonadaceae bacterium]|nr:LamG-like jellyroll fold domain-containing protein [Cellulomonadaceae bacterium]